MADEAFKQFEDRDTGWIAVSLGFAFCITSKEAVRYTALWTFELKPPLLMIAITLFVITGFAMFYVAVHRGSVRLWKSNAVLYGLAGMQCAGMAVHVLRMSGLAFPDWTVFLSFVVIESSLLLLAVYLQFLLNYSWPYRLSAFVWGIVAAGAMQVLLVFVSVDAARWLVAASPLMAVSMLSFARSKGESPLEESEDAEQNGRGFARFSLKDSLLSPRSFSGYCTVVFLVSIVLMGAYSQWRGQQDGYIVSALVQVCSGFGLMLPALAMAMMGRFLRGRSIFYLCQTIVLPIALGALYLATVFSGPSVSLSVLLFDAAYGVLLFVVWIAPSVFSKENPFGVVCAGLLSYKLGWFVGVFATASLPQEQFAWAGSIVVTLAFMMLVVISAVSLVSDYLSSEKSTSTANPVVQPLEDACLSLGKDCQLTEREREVLLLLARGRTASYIARDLVVSEPTVRTHISHIYRKTNVNSQQQLLDKVEELMRERSMSGDSAK